MKIDTNLKNGEYKLRRSYFFNNKEIEIESILINIKDGNCTIKPPRGIDSKIKSIHYDTNNLNKVQIRESHNISSYIWAIDK